MKEADGWSAEYVKDDGFKIDLSDAIEIDLGNPIPPMGMSQKRLNSWFNKYYEKYGGGDKFLNMFFNLYKCNK